MFSYKAKKRTDKEYGQLTLLGNQVDALGVAVKGFGNTLTDTMTNVVEKKDAQINSLLLDLGSSQQREAEFQQREAESARKLEDSEMRGRFLVRHMASGSGTARQLFHDGPVVAHSDVKMVPMNNHSGLPLADPPVPLPDAVPADTRARPPAPPTTTAALTAMPATDGPPAVAVPTRNIVKEALGPLVAFAAAELNIDLEKYANFIKLRMDARAVARMMDSDALVPAKIVDIFNVVNELPKINRDKKSTHGKAGSRTRKKTAPRKKTLQDQLKETLARMNLHKKDDTDDLDEDANDEFNESPGK